MTDVDVAWVDGAFASACSSRAAFHIAARAAMVAGCEKAGVRILEPIMSVSIRSPVGSVEAIRGDLDGRRGRLLSHEPNADAASIEATAPLATLIGYRSSLQALTDGRATCEMRFSHYAEIPHYVAGDDPGTFPPAVGMRA